MVRQLCLTALHTRSILCMAGGRSSPTGLTLPCLITLEMPTEVGLVSLRDLTLLLSANRTLFSKGLPVSLLPPGRRSRFGSDWGASALAAASAPRVLKGARAATGSLRESPAGSGLLLPLPAGASPRVETHARGLVLSLLTRDKPVAPSARGPDGHRPDP